MYNAMQVRHTFTDTRPSVNLLDLIKPLGDRGSWFTHQPSVAYTGEKHIRPDDLATQVNFAASSEPNYENMYVAAIAITSVSNTSNVTKETTKPTLYFTKSAKVLEGDTVKIVPDVHGMNGPCGFTEFLGNHAERVWPTPNVVWTAPVPTLSSADPTDPNAYNVIRQNPRTLVELPATFESL